MNVQDEAYYNTNIKNDYKNYLRYPFTIKYSGN